MINMGDEMDRQDEKMKREKKDIVSSMLAKIIAFFLLCIGVVTAALGGAGTGYVESYGGYKGNDSEFIRQLMIERIWSDYRELKDHYMDIDYNTMDNFLAKTNLDMEIYTGNDEDGYNHKVWGEYQGPETPYTYNIYSTITVTEQEAEKRFGPDVWKNAASDSSANVDETEENMEGSVDSVEVPGDTLDETSTFMVADEGATDQEDWEENSDVTSQPGGTQDIQLDFKFYVDPSFTIQDDYKLIYENGSLMLKYQYVFPVVAGVGLLLTICSFLFLMCAAGHHRNQEGVSKGILTAFHFDLVTIFFGIVAFGILIFLVQITYSIFDNVLVAALFLCALVAEVVWCTIYCMELAVELKLGILFQNTLIRKILVGFVHLIGKIWKGFVELCRGLPLIWRVLLAYGVLTLAEFWGILICNAWDSLLALWFVEKVILFLVIAYVTFTWKKLEQAGEALAEGNMDYRVDTSGMVFTFKNQGESLNRIGEGITLTVEERMKSEHLKTELITNVSHDLKTPLTSIINYADLLGTLPEKEDIDREKLSEYAEVLLRQSKRLKKLLEDLIEASKATTGNLEVNLTSCEIGVLLSQTVGEYQQKLQEKQMQLITKQPEEPVVIQADGRHLWRIFDNLFNNICKYGQENTRVYLTVEKQEKEVLIAFKNISKYPLELSGEELQERFVRGDKSRHMEGNGLGLSIAGSLAELQGGSMEITTDGDLFKVVLRFPVMKEAPINK